VIGVGAEHLGHQQADGDVFVAAVASGKQHMGSAAGG
jgi:hypothetical protein